MFQRNVDVTPWATKDTIDSGKWLLKFQRLEEKTKTCHLKSYESKISSIGILESHKNKK